MKRISVIAVAVLTSFAVASPGIAQHFDYKSVVARSLDYKSGDKRHFSVTEPWTPLVGGLMVCARLDLLDGRGGFVPSTDYSMFHIVDGKVVSVIKDDTILGCPNRTYSDLPAVPN
jgi:hypothetical protein